jgi:glycosyltransferase involved in cell wall biosynthesis
MIDLYEALASEANASVRVVCQSEIPSARKNLGWKDIRNHGGKTEFIVNPSISRVRELLDSSIDAVHIVGGIVHHRNGMAVATRSMRAKIKWGLLSEVPNSTGPLKRAAYWSLMNTLARKRSFTLAIGEHALNWYRKMNACSDCIFPFAYFVSIRETFADWADEEKNAGFRPVKIIYAGRLTAGKGLEPLLESLGGCKDLAWTLTICGDGPFREQLVHRIGVLGIRERVNILGVVPFEKIQDVIRDHDWLVLPSIAKDGWGVVINEALAVGTRVICSSICGASELVASPDEGFVVQRMNFDVFCPVLRRAIRQGPTPVPLRGKIRRSAQAFSPQAGAKYLLNIVDYTHGLAPRPEASWLGARPQAIVSPESINRPAHEAYRT